MTNPIVRSWNTPNEHLGLRGIANRAGISVSVLPNGCVFAIEHRNADRAILVNQLLLRRLSKAASPESSCASAARSR